MFSQFSFQDMYPNEICTLTVCSNTSITQADHLPHQFWYFLLPLIHLPDHTHFSGVPQQRQCGHSHRRMSMLCHLCQSEHEHLQLVEKKKIIFFISKQNKQDYVSIIQPECRNISVRQNENKSHFRKDTRKFGLPCVMLNALLPKTHKMMMMMICTA